MRHENVLEIRIILEKMFNMKKWLDKVETSIKKHWILYTIIFFIILPLLLNIGIYITDVIYNAFGWTLTASGLGNQNWLGFWGTYLSVVIAFIGICLAWKSSAEDRKVDENEKLAQEYDEHLKEEKNILIEVCQSFNTDIIFKAINELNNMDIGECRRILQNSRERVLNVQVKFELLSDVADDFQKCKGCDFNPCYDKKNMIAIRDLYYEIEKIYLEMLNDFAGYVDKMEQQQRNEEIMQNEEKLISLLQTRICLAKDTSTSNSGEDIKRMKEEIAQLRYNLETLKGQRVENAEIQKLVNSVADTINLMTQEKKPQLIRYCKSYMNWKSRHKRELLLEGKIQYIEYPDCSEKTNLKN